MPYPQNPYMNYQTGYQPQALPTMQSQASYPAPSSNGINWVSGGKRCEVMDCWKRGIRIADGQREPVFLPQISRCKRYAFAITGI